MAVGLGRPARDCSCPDRLSSALPAHSLHAGDDSAEKILLALQQRILGNLSWVIAAGSPPLLLVWEYYRREAGAGNAVPLLFQLTLLAGVVLHYGLLRRGTPRVRGLILVGWIGALASLSQIFNGPLPSNGIAWTCAAMLGTFFVGHRAGLAVMAGFVVVTIVQIYGIRGGWLPLPRDLTLSGGPLTILRVAGTGLIPMAMCHVAFANVCRSWTSSLMRAVEERRERDAAREAQRLAEATMEANQHFEGLGKLSSGVAHDVNNALTVVQCNAELLEHLSPPGENRTLAGDILTAARSAAQTTRQLLSFTRRSICAPRPIAPGRIVETVGRLVTRALAANIRLVLRDNSSRPILVDEGDLQQALLNLVLNARDAMPDGGKITVTVEDATLANGSPGVALRIRDTGTGIPPDLLARVFTPFFTTKPAGRGTGLGLSMVKSFVDEAGGTITLDSKPNQGTTVSLLFPAAALASGPAAVEFAPENLPESSRILLIENRDDLRSILQRVLTRGGYAVTACTNLDEARACWEKEPTFDLLCLDGGKGAAALELVKEMLARRSDLRVLLCTGQLDEEWQNQSLAVSILRKPYTGTELLARVRSLRPIRGSAPPMAGGAAGVPLSR